MLIAVAVVAVVVLGGLALRAVRRRRQGWYDLDGGASSADARGAVNRNSWMLGGGGGGGGG